MRALHEMGDRMRERVELAAQSMASSSRARLKRCGRGCRPSTGDGLDMLPALDHSPRREQTPGSEMEQPGQTERDRQRERERQRGFNGPDIGLGR